MKRSLLIALAALSLSACAKQNSQPAFVQEIKQSRATITSSTGTHERVISEVTLLKSAILNRTFLYSDTLQTSSMKDGDKNISMLSLVIGTLPAEFKILDDKLRLVTDGKINVESDVNHPSRLILELKILKQDETSITVKADEASPILDTFLVDNTADKPRPAKQASFIRSMEYVEPSELFMIESTVELADGTVAEVMETLVPRDRVVSKDDKPLYNNKEVNPLAARYRFFDGPKFFADVEGKGRIEVTTGKHYVLSSGKPIQWWASANTPDQYLLDVRNGVEAWNRYTQASNGTDLVQFMGKLPDGVKIGDPRYNVVVWDRVADAGAAYASQSADPYTGVVINSLIYLPGAWINIGKTYWKNAARAEEASNQREADVKKLVKTRLLGGVALPVQCVESAIMQISPESRTDPETFGRKLLRDTLFHEVGHTLGLAHNFKGSLSFDLDTGKGFSTSIMDYNNYSEEMAAFDSLETSTGPLLEYDRQIISQIYNGGKDVKSSDPVVPACNDEEADSSKGGMDPLCIRYDAGNDPVKTAQRALELLSQKDARSGKLHSLPVALESILSEIPAPTSLASMDEVKKSLDALREAVKGTATLYLNSLGSAGGNAAKSLHVFQAGVLPPGYDEADLRTRAYSVMQDVMGTTELPEASKTALVNVRGALLSFVQASAGYQSLTAADQSKALAEATENLDNDMKGVENVLLANARLRMMAALKYNADAPLSFLKQGSANVDLEAEVVKALETSTTAKVGAFNRPAPERLEAAKTLATYKSSGSAKDAMERLKTSVDAEILASQDARQRETLRKLREALP